MGRLWGNLVACIWPCGSFPEIIESPFKTFLYVCICDHKHTGLISRHEHNTLRHTSIQFIQALDCMCPIKCRTSIICTVMKGKIAKQLQQVSVTCKQISAISPLTNLQLLCFLCWRPLFAWVWLKCMLSHSMSANCRSWRWGSAEVDFSN